MIRVFSSLLLALAFVAVSQAMASTIKAQHGGTVSAIGDASVELVTNRTGDTVDFTAYVLNKEQKPIKSGDLVITCIGSDNKSVDVTLAPGKDDAFHGTAKITNRGPIKIKETYTNVGGRPAVATLELKSM